MAALEVSLQVDHLCEGPAATVRMALERPLLGMRQQVVEKSLDVGHLNPADVTAASAFFKLALEEFERSVSA